MRRRWMAWCLSVIAAMCVAAEDTPAPGTVVRYRDFGAKGDGQTLDTRAIQAAIDSASACGGETVAKYVDGVLTITLPRVKEEKPRSHVVQVK